MPRFRIKRVYEPYAPEDGFRVLVDRLWPRGISKARHLKDGPVTLIYAARDEQRNNAAALQAWLERP